MGEVSYLKLKLADMEGKQGHGTERQHKAEVGVLIQMLICCGQKVCFFYYKMLVGFHLFAFY